MYLLVRTVFFCLHFVRLCLNMLLMRNEVFEFVAEMVLNPVSGHITAMEI